MPPIGKTPDWFEIKLPAVKPTDGELYKAAKFEEFGTFSEFGFRLENIELEEAAGIAFGTENDEWTPASEGDIPLLSDSVEASEGDVLQVIGIVIMPGVKETDDDDEDDEDEDGGIEIGACAPKWMDGWSDWIGLMLKGVAAVVDDKWLPCDDIKLIDSAPETYDERGVETDWRQVFSCWFEGELPPEVCCCVI